MAGTKTNYYDLEKPEIDADSNVWGEKINRDLDTLDWAIRNCLHANTHPNFDTPLTVNQCNLPITVPAQTGGVTNNNLVTTQGWVEQRIVFYLNKFWPVGSVMLWTGGWGSVPAGWTFCDGTYGSPNLQDRFVICAGPYMNQIGAVMGEPTYNPGEHIHQYDDYLYPGPAGPDVVSLRGGAATFGAGGSPMLPCVVLSYIYKYAAW